MISAGSLESAFDFVFLMGVPPGDLRVKIEMRKSVLIRNYLLLFQVFQADMNFYKFFINSNLKGTGESNITFFCDELK